MSKVKDQNYIVIQGWMLSQLELKGNDLLIYGIIYGFSQDGNNKFTGSRQYLADWTNSTKQGVTNSLTKLLEKGLITKEEHFIHGVKFCYYQAIDLTGVGKLVDGGWANHLTGGGQISCPYNKEEKKEYNKEDKKETASGHVDLPIAENIVNKKSKKTEQGEQVEQFEKFWEAYDKKTKKTEAVKSFNKALSKASFEVIMNGVQEYNQYRLIATWQTRADATTWLNNGRWEDDYNSLIKDECKKQGKTPPVQQRSHEKQQEEVKQANAIQDKIKAFEDALKPEEVEFMIYIRQHLKNSFSGIHYDIWIKTLIFTCRAGKVVIRVGRNIEDSWDKIKNNIERELKAKNFKYTEITWKEIV